MRVVLRFASQYRLVMKPPNPPRTLAQRTNAAGWPKPAEIIEVTGMGALEAADRAILNLLYQHAHDSGRMDQPGARWEVPMAELRFSMHDSNDRLRQSLRRLLAVSVDVTYYDPQVGTDVVLQTHLFESFVTPRSGNAAVRYSMPSDLCLVLARSARWGRIKAEIICAMTSKYAISLYELLALRVNMERCVEYFPIDRFRNLLGVPAGTYERGNDFARSVLDIAALEVNGLSDIGVQIEMKRRSPRAAVEGVTVAWWLKAGDDFRRAIAERNRSKLGRMARLTGKVEVAV
jgi:Initiator Replication protein